jgi:hypothetical protein
MIVYAKSISYSYEYAFHIMQICTNVEYGFRVT